MQFETPEWIQWIKAFGFTLLAVFGGLFGFIMRALDAGEGINWPRAFIEAGASGFVGLLVLFSCLAIGVTEYWTGLIVGVSGWVGAKASIEMLMRLVNKRTPYNVGEVKDEPEN